MGVSSDGSYGVPKDIVFSFPVTCKNGKYQIVQNLKINDFIRGGITKTAFELVQERDEASVFLASRS